MNKTCKDCIHYDVCLLHEDNFIADANRNGFCGKHKSKSRYIELPCKVGDIVYAKYSGTNEIEYYVVDMVAHLGSNCFEFEAHFENEDGYTVDTIEFTVPEISKTVFLTKEEAEAKFKELENIE